MGNEKLSGDIAGDILRQTQLEAAGLKNKISVLTAENENLKDINIKKEQQIKQISDMFNKENSKLKAMITEYKDRVEFLEKELQPAAEEIQVGSGAVSRFLNKIGIQIIATTETA